MRRLLLPSLALSRKNICPAIAFLGPPFCRPPSLPRRPERIGPMELLDGDAFGEVARLVDVTLQLDGEMVGEELQGNDGENRADEIGDFGNSHDVVGDSFEMIRAIAGSDD